MVSFSFSTKYNIYCISKLPAPILLSKKKKKKKKPTLTVKMPLYDISRVAVAQYRMICLILFIRVFPFQCSKLHELVHRSTNLC